MANDTTVDGSGLKAPSEETLMAEEKALKKILDEIDRKATSEGTASAEERALKEVLHACSHNSNFDSEVVADTFLKCLKESTSDEALEDLSADASLLTPSLPFLDADLTSFDPSNDIRKIDPSKLTSAQANRLRNALLAAGIAYVTDPTTPPLLQRITQSSTTIHTRFFLPLMAQLENSECLLGALRALDQATRALKMYLDVNNPRAGGKGKFDLAELARLAVEVNEATGVANACLERRWVQQGGRGMVGSEGGEKRSEDGDKKGEGKVVETAPEPEPEPKPRKPRNKIEAAFW